MIVKASMPFLCVAMWVVCLGCGAQDGEPLEDVGGAVAPVEQRVVENGPARTSVPATTGETVLDLAVGEAARPVTGSGLPNAYRVRGTLLRGAQPDREGFLRLAAMGVRTVVNLRSFHSDRDKIAGTGLDYVEIPMTAWSPKDEDVLRFLQVATDPARLPVFVQADEAPAGQAGVATGQEIPLHRIEVVAAAPLYRFGGMA